MNNAEHFFDNVRTKVSIYFFSFHFFIFCRFFLFADYENHIDLHKLAVPLENWRKNEKRFVLHSYFSTTTTTKVQKEKEENTEKFKEKRIFFFLLCCRLMKSFFFHFIFFCFFTDPHVRILGRPNDVLKAKDRILAALDSRVFKIILFTFLSLAFLFVFIFP